MKTPADLTIEPLTIRRWMLRGAWALYAVIVVLLLWSAWADWGTDQRLTITAMVLTVPAGLLLAGAVWIGAAHEKYGDYSKRVEKRRPLCFWIAGVTLLAEFALWLPAVWVEHGGNLAQTAAALLSVTVVALLMSVDWAEF